MALGVPGEEPGRRVTALQKTLNEVASPLWVQSSKFEVQRRSVTDARVFFDNLESWGVLRIACEGKFDSPHVEFYILEMVRRPLRVVARWEPSPPRYLGGYLRYVSVPLESGGDRGSF